MQVVIVTGILAGFIHVVSGADHLIAMAPSSITSPKIAARNSISWGLGCLLYTSPSPRDRTRSRMPSSA